MASKVRGTGSSDTNTGRRRTEASNSDMDWQAAFASGLEYSAFLTRYATAEQRSRWSAVEQSASLSDGQRRLLARFERELNVLCLAGTWCPDCAAQCPLLEQFARLSSKIRLRFVDRDEDAELAEALRVCGGGRVPVAVFLSEDFVECGRYGDRSLARYRQLASEQVAGASEVIAAVSEFAPADVVGDWLREFERIHWMLRLSPRLRKVHGD